MSVALLRGDEVVAEERPPVARAAAADLLPAVDALLRGAGVALADIAAIAVSVGPGSFTSLRVGIATAKGLAFGTRCGVIAVPTLASLSRTAPAGDAPVAAMLDARRGEVYAAVYEPADAGVPLELLPAGVFTPEELAQHLPDRCTLVGEGAGLYGDRVRALRGEGVRVVPPPASDPSAAHVGVLGARLGRIGGLGDAADLTPRYVRRAEAEVTRTGERFESP
jgi:tRNA threonylcarbamoyladenosine biosynthesis protein TsaB